LDIYAFPPIAAILDAAYGALTSLSTALEPLAGTAAAAAAVILVTLLIRAALIPVGVSQAKAEQTRARLAPKLRELQKRHKKNPKRLQRETMQLYKDENTSPFASCTRCSCAPTSPATRMSCSRTTCSAPRSARASCTCWPAVRSRCRRCSSISRSSRS
jgi:hypothetical protein